MPVPTESREPGSRSREGGSKSERTRERIVIATARVLNTRGYAGTRLSDIAQLAEVQAPAIYYYFSSRDELIEQAVSEGLARAADLVGAALESVADAGPMERLEAAVEAHLTTLLTHSEHAAAAVRTVTQMPPDIRDRQLAAQRAYIDIWRALFDEADAAGAIDPAMDRRAALMLVLNALNSTAGWWDGEQGTFDDVLATARALVRKGLARP